MIKKPSGTHKKGFTLIEIMIVIAIIGVLAAIAIPNFVNYRNKAFCTSAESDASAIEAAIIDYFAMPSHIATPAISDLNQSQGVTLSGSGGVLNTATITGADANVNITITVTDASGRCPTDYQDASSRWSGNNIYTLNIRR